MLRTTLVLTAVLASIACDVRVGEKGVSLGIGGGKASDVWTRTYTLQPGGRLNVVNTNGRIDVLPATGPAVEVSVAREARAGSDDAAREALRQVVIDEQVSDGAVTLELRQPAQRSGFGRPEVSAHYTVRVPPGLVASFRTQNGAVRLTNVAGQFTAATTNGGITASGVSGAVSASTINGGLQLELVSVTAPMELSAVNGGIRLSLPRDVAAELEATAVNGGVSVDDQLDLARTGDTGAGGFAAGARMSGSLNGGGPRISAQTTNGGVRISAHDVEVEAAQR